LQARSMLAHRSGAVAGKDQVVNDLKVAAPKS
jgi:hypothetical protein